MRQGCLLFCLFAFLCSVCWGQVIFYQESRDSSGATNPDFYREFGSGWYASGSTAKSKAEGLQGTGSRFSNAATIGDATYRFYPQYSPLFDASKMWNIYVTVPGGYDSIQAENAVWTISENGINRNTAGTVPLVGFGPPDGKGPAGDKWLLVAEGVQFASEEGYVEFREYPPQTNRFYADAIKYEENLTMTPNPEKTATNTPTPTPTAAQPTITNTPLSVTSECRALWVTRGNYRSESDVDNIVRNAAEHNFNVLLFQIRGNGTAFYQSQWEPWAYELTGTDPSTLGQDPGWNPLTYACLRAHEAGLQLHAYVNVFPAWQRTVPPPEGVNQLWNTHRDWFMQDVNGSVMWPQGSWDYWYTFVDPGVPGVKQHLRNVILDIVQNYDVDGIHYDYIRYPHEVGDWSYNQISVNRFKDLHGKDPSELPLQWNHWRRDQISDIVSSVYQDVCSVDKSAVLSAAVMKSWSTAYDHAFQNYREWMSNGSLDAGILMLYIQDLNQFRGYVSEALANCSGRWIVPGLGAHNTDTNTLLDLINISRELGTQGTALFAYGNLFPGHVPNDTALALLKGPFRDRATVPDMPWKQSGLGYLMTK